MRVSVVLTAIVLFCVGASCKQGEGITAAELAADIDFIISQPQFDGMDWGILVEQERSEGSYSTVYAHNDGQYFIPAGNNKIFTTAAAYLYFENDFNISTPFVASSASGNINDACVIGRGDPSIGFSQVEEFVNSLQRAGIESVETLTFDDSYFPSFPVAWEWEDLQRYYGAQPNSLVLAQNAATFYVGPGFLVGWPVSVSFENEADDVCVDVVDTAITVQKNGGSEGLSIFYRFADPRIYIEGDYEIGRKEIPVTVAMLQPADRFACVFNYYMEQNNITVKAIEMGKCQNTTSWTTVDSLVSKDSFRDIMKYTLQHESENLSAEFILRTLGANFYNPSGMYNAEQNGLSAVKQILVELGVRTDDFYQDDGSGLSRQNLVKPRAMAKVLELMGNSTYRSYFPVTVESGPYANPGIAEAIPGSMSGVSSFSGYVNASDVYPQIVFTIIANYSPPSLDNGRELVESAINAIVHLLCNLVPN